MTTTTRTETITKSATQSKLSTGRVLVVDDEERMASSLQAVLAKEGHEVAIALSGEEAIHCLEREPYDVLLVDVRMPKVGGVDVLRKARDINPDRPVILMTAYASLESAVAAINEGAYDYLLKPIDLTEMRLTVRRAIEVFHLNQMRWSLVDELQEKNKSLSRRVVELNALHEVGAALSTTGEVSKLLKSILNLATGVIGACYGSIMLLDEERGTLRVAANSGNTSPYGHTVTEIPVGDSIAGQVARTGEPLIVKDVENDPRFSRRNRPQFETNSLICAPLKTPNGVLGTISLSDKRDRSQFTMEDLRLLVTLAAQAAMAIADSQHYQQIRQRLDEVTALHNLSDTLTKVERTDEMVAAVSKTLREVANCDRIQWWEWHSDPKQIVLAFDSQRPVAREGEMTAITASCETFNDVHHCAQAIREAMNHIQSPAGVGTILALPVRSAESPLGVFALFRDHSRPFTEHETHLVTLVRSQAERIFERQRALLNASRLVTMGKMISEIAHDLRKPLTNIRGALQVLQSRVDNDTENAGILRETDREIVRLATLVQELVDFSNPRRYRTARRDIAAGLRRALSLIERAAQKNGVTINANIPDRLPPIFCDENQIIEALLNILMNAVEAMPNGGILTFDVQVEENDDPGEQVVITITDTGPGMQRSELARIFERYYTTKDSGTGLGLPIVQRIIQSHDGVVTADSAPGIGTTFRVELPVR
ncbi:MAG: hypothetical protein Kow0074_19310 [Candidatus Zixiibacteriota bacterium]